jgi:hypothetical protein
MIRDRVRVRAEREGRKDDKKCRKKKMGEREID